MVYAQIWEDLQTTNVAKARIDLQKACFDSFLMALHFMKCYPTGQEQAATFKYCVSTARTWCWYYCEKIQAMKAEKVRKV